MSPPYLLPMTLGVFYGSTELIISAVKRSRAGAVRNDRGSLQVFWIGIPLAIWLSVYVAITVPLGRFSLSPPLEWTAIAVFVAGIALRWYSIIHLGRFFTVDVAIAPDHRVVDTGPYRLIRHPSYTGGLLAFVGAGLAMGNVLSIAVLMVPIAFVYLYRIQVEEAALRTGLGEPYMAYVARTRKLIPKVF